MVQIIPSLLVTNEGDFKDQISAIKGTVSMIQIDLADGRFVPSLTWPYDHPKEAQQHLNLHFELHLMASDPIAVFGQWQSNHYLKRVLFHYEAVTNPGAIIQTINNKQPSIQVGLALNPDTPVAVLDPYLKKIQAVMFMGVRPGAQGQKFIPDTINRIKAFKAKGTNHLVEVDGAVNEKTLPDLVKAGVDVACPGSAVFGNEKTPAENIKRLRRIIQRLTKT